MVMKIFGPWRDTAHLQRVILPIDSSETPSPIAAYTGSGLRGDSSAFPPSAGFEHHRG